jgi:hypothetical protein
MRNFSRLKYFCKGYKKRMQYTFGYFTERWGVGSFFQFHVLDTCRHGRHMGFLVFLFQYDVDGCSQVLDEVSCVASIQHDAVCNLGNFNCMTFSTCFSWPWGNGEEIGIELSGVVVLVSAKWNIDTTSVLRNKTSSFYVFFCLTKNYFK